METSHPPTTKIKLSDKLQLRFLEEPIPLRATLVDISLGGLGVHTTRRIPVGSEVTVVIGFLDPDQGIVHESVAGMVRWCRIKGIGFAAGIELEELIPERHFRLLGYLNGIGHFRQSVTPSKGSNPP